MSGRIDLCAPHQIKLLVSLFSDPAICEDPGTVNDAANGAVPGTSFIDTVFESDTITHIDGSVFDAAAEIPQCFEEPRHLAHPEDLGGPGAYRSWRVILSLEFEASRLQLIVGHTQRPVRFIARCCSSTEQQKVRLVTPGHFFDTGRRHASSSAGDDHEATFSHQLSLLLILGGELQLHLDSTGRSEADLHSISFDQFIDELLSSLAGIVKCQR